ncbi:AraC family transcriptional regulator [Nocardiopsis terrae]|uniref:AraC-like DNA-binding protein n=1 Tax=Nocardiopsis terrae TaxID=372655 RepID=A0ABR9HHM4_9ACTN|nr:AraC family transcriptional regulator [Nocardiopsis terrae]MBE1458529.1 AraC-like DNA-binding protein [Nocardiopsis terrae]GHC79905.1 AraC family transcriptional regulator [Nocardiopsis terrae]
MDALADLLDGVRARGALFSRSVMSPPWALRFAPGSPLTLVTMVRGRAWLVPEHDTPVPLAAGDTVLLRAPGPHTVANPAEAPVSCTVLDGNRCLGPDGDPLQEEATLGLRTYGDSLDAPDLLLSGSYDVTGDLSRRLFAALPPTLVVPADECHDRLGAMIEAEIGCPAPGQQLVLDRLLDLALITKLRVWFSLPGTQPPAWYTAMADPVVGQALRLLHNQPAHPWTVAALAERCGVSRATLARDFRALAGTPPMSYLAEWRVSLAADLLRDTDTTVEVIARRVGYANAFALSTAFKRLRGTTPTAHRRATAPAELNPPAPGAATEDAVPVRTG